MYDSKRKVYRISKGAILEAQPTKGSGYNQTNVSQPFYGEGRWSFVMERRQKNGELQARSKKTEISYEVDEEAPSAEVRLNGKKQKQLFTSDFCVCSAENVQDDTAGEVQIQWYLAREKLDDGQITQKQVDEQGKPIYQDVCYPVTKDFREKLYNEIISEYEKAKDKSNENARESAEKHHGNPDKEKDKEATPFR